MKRIMMAILLGLTLIVITGCNESTVDFTKTTKITFNNLTAEIPSVFEKDEENSYKDFIQYYFDTSDNKNSCMLRFSKMENYTSDDLKEEVYNSLLMREDIEYSTKTVNGSTWSTGYYTSGEKLIAHAYAINHKNTLYSFEYDDFGSGDLCDQAFNQITNTLKLN